MQSSDSHNYNSHSIIKKYGYKLNKWLYGQTSNVCNGCGGFSTKLNMSGRIALSDSPSNKLATYKLSLQGEPL